MIFRRTRHGAKLTDEQAAQIRERADAGEKHYRLAEEFGVSASCIHRIALRLSYWQPGMKKKEESL